MTHENMSTWMQAASYISDDLLCEHWEYETRLKRKRKHLRAMGASCAAVLLCMLVLMPLLIKSPVGESFDEPDVPSEPTDLRDQMGPNESHQDIVATFSYKYDIQRFYHPIGQELPLGEMPQVGSLMSRYAVFTDEGKVVGPPADRQEAASMVHRAVEVLRKSMGLRVPAYRLTVNDYGEWTTKVYAQVIHSGGRLTTEKWMDYRQKPDVNVLTIKSPDHENGHITLNGSSLYVDQRLSDQEIIDSLGGKRGLLCEAFGVNFYDAYVERDYSGDMAFEQEFGVSSITVYFYDRSSHPLYEKGPIVGLANRPLGSYIALTFDNHPFDKDKISSASYLRDVTITYVDMREEPLGRFSFAGQREVISLEEAKALLDCLCRCDKCKEKDVKELSEYDAVGFAYVHTGVYSRFHSADEIYSQERAVEIIPCYAFYTKYDKRPSEGKELYRVVYIPAIKIYGLAEFYQAHAQKHAEMLQTSAQK